MTLVSVRYDKSFGFPRFSALADSRASSQRKDGSYTSIQDTTTKLFAIPVRCFNVDQLMPPVGLWTSPHYETQVGLGFSGSCFECLSLIALITRCFGHLVAPNNDSLEPQANGLVGLAQELIERYFKNHAKAEDEKHGPKAYFLLFGFEKEKPWLTKISWTPKQKSKIECFQVTDSDLITIGEISTSEQYGKKLLERVKKQSAKIQAKKFEGQDRDAHEVEIAKLSIAQKKIAENVTLEAIENEYLGSIGGILQRIELCYLNGQVLSAYSQDNTSGITDCLRSVTTEGCLGYVPINELMGSQGTRARTKK
jgi:hypothetical protein